MKVGDKVKIYQDPYTKKDFEGIARVERILHSSIPQEKHVIVEFEDEKGTFYPRIIID